MKGLASTSPAFATVGINGRAARTHYGLNVGMKYFDLEHDHTKKVWDAYFGFYRIYMMDWFIEKVLLTDRQTRLGCSDRADTGQQGSLVKEDDPLRLSYCRKRLVSRGPFTTISTAIYFSSDPQNSGAPKYVEDGKSRIPTPM